MQVTRRRVPPSKAQVLSRAYARCLLFFLLVVNSSFPLLSADGDGVSERKERPLFFTK